MGRMGQMGRMGRAGRGGGTAAARPDADGGQGGRMARGRGFHGVEIMLPLCGKVPETRFHCVENFAKHVSIVWENPRNLLPLCGKSVGAGGGGAMAVDCTRWQSMAVEEMVF